MWFWFVIAIPVVWPFIAKKLWGKELTWLELTANIVVVVLMVGALWSFGRYSAADDYEIWNGQVTGKERVRVSCDHSYECRCSTDSKGRKSCSTCYEHSYDVDWTVNTNVGDFDIDRVNRQGTTEPPRWTKVQTGQSVAQRKSYVNWVKAVPESLFNVNSSEKEKYEQSIPEYPIKVYDYHYLNRVLAVGVSIPDIDQWNTDLSNELKLLGPKKQANVVVVVTNITDPTYAHGLKSSWLGGKKNDIVVVIGTSSWPTIDWVDVFSWSKNDLINVSLRDNLLALGQLDRVKFMEILRTDIMANFDRRPMAEFEYLKDEIDPPVWLIIVTMIVGLIASVGLSVFLSNNSVKN